MATVQYCSDCGSRIVPGELSVVLKWGPRQDKLIFLGSIPLVVRCLKCNGVAGKTVKKNRPADQSKAPSDAKIHAGVRRNVLRVLQRAGAPLETKTIVLRIRKKEKYRAVSKEVFVNTLRAMREDRELRRTDGKWALRTGKKAKA